MRNWLPTMWSGGGGLARPSDLFNRYFDRFFEEFGSDFPATGSLGFTPSLDVCDRGDAYVLCVELPGIDPKEVDIECIGDTLTIRGEKKTEVGEGKGGYSRYERRYGSFARSVRLDGIDPDKVKAELRNGVLTVTAPKTEAVKPRRVEITGGAGAPTSIEAKSGGEKARPHVESKGAKA